MDRNTVLEVKIVNSRHEIYINTSLVRAPEHVGMIIGDSYEHFLRAFNVDLDSPTADTVLGSLLKDLHEKGIIKDLDFNRGTDGK